MAMVGCTLQLLGIFVFYHTIWFDGLTHARKIQDHSGIMRTLKEMDNIQRSEDNILHEIKTKQNKHRTSFKGKMGELRVKADNIWREMARQPKNKGINQEKKVMKKIRGYIYSLSPIDRISDAMLSPGNDGSPSWFPINIFSGMKGLQKESFTAYAAIARASSSHKNGIHEPMNAFDESGGFWHSAAPYTVPQSLWVEFLEPVNIMAYSFTSRTDNTKYMDTDGPSMYVFWASNHINDCGDESHWVILHTDNSGTPFEKTNAPKMENMENNNLYRCYGFKVTNVPGRDGIKPVTIANVVLYTRQEFQEVSVAVYGVMASSSHETGNHEPVNAIHGSGGFWHSGLPYTVPQSLWVEFVEPVRVVKYSFTSRTDNTKYMDTDGPSKYIFWASNYINDCGDESHWVILYTDNSGTHFEKTNEPKMEIIENNNLYRCYGFKVTDVPGRDSLLYEGFIQPVTIANVQLYTDIVDCSGLDAMNIGGKCLTISEDELNWNEALTVCKNNGGRLVSLHNIKCSETLHDFLFNNYQGQRFWLGGSDSANEGHWVWMDGQPFQQFPWRHPQPDNVHGGQDCLQWGFDNYFDDENCEGQGRYICELECNGGVIIAGQCLKFSTEKLSWEDAKKRCSSQNARLATLNDPEAFQQYALQNYGDDKIWLGGSDIGQEGEFIWVDGQPLGDQFPWKKGQPDNGGDEDCLMWGHKKQYNDGKCHIEFIFVCEH